ncbi:hypothetical protein MHYP_G00334790 [Metynnis hypsauchen]
MQSAVIASPRLHLKWLLRAGESLLHGRGMESGGVMEEWREEERKREPSHSLTSGAASLIPSGASVSLPGLA